MNSVNAGETLTYTNSGSAINSGSVVVVGQQVCVALVDIPNGGTGTLAAKGRFTLPKVSAAVIAQGESVIWDASESAFEDNQATPATGDVSGCCVAAEAAGDGDTSIDILLNIGIGTVA